MTQRIRSAVDPAAWRERIIHTAVIDLSSGCWEWPDRDKNGYGKFRFRVDGLRRMTGAHRAAWLAFNGPMEGDLVVDHLCRNVACCNVAHLDLVTNGENGRRGDHAGKQGRSGTRAGLELHSCGKHGRDDGYLRLQRDGYVRWECRICRRARINAYRRRCAA